MPINAIKNISHTSFKNTISADSQKENKAQTNKNKDALSLALVVNAALAIAGILILKNKSTKITQSIKKFSLIDTAPTKERFYNNGNIKYREYSNGDFEWLFENGSINMLGNKKNGSYKWYYPDKKLREEKLADGSKRSYRPDGSLIYKKSNNGDFVWYHPDGSIKQEDFFTEKTRIIHN